MKNTTRAVIVLVACVFLAACSYAKTGPNTVGVKYQTGVGSASHFKGCIGISGSYSTNSLTTSYDLYRYPARTITYDATGGGGSERAPFTIVSKDNAELNVPITINMDMLTDCPTLQKFHENWGLKYKAYFNEDGTYPKGWVDLLNFMVGQPLNQTLNRIAQQYTWRQIWNDAKVKSEIEQSVNEKIEQLVKDQAGGVNYFQNFHALVGKPDVQDDNLKSAINQAQSSVASAQAQQAQADAQRAAALAQVAVAQAQAKSKEAEIHGYGGIDAYLKAQAIDKGLNPFQPTYIVSSTK